MANKKIYKSVIKGFKGDCTLEQRLSNLHDEYGIPGWFKLVETKQTFYGIIDRNGEVSYGVRDGKTDTGHE